MTAAKNRKSHYLATALDTEITKVVKADFRIKWADLELMSSKDMDEYKSRVLKVSAAIRKMLSTTRAVLFMYTTK